MPSSDFARFNRALVAWSAVLLSTGAVALWGLERTGHLPPPPITATNCIDEKFKFLHETPVKDRNLVAVGSSVTWRNLDFAAIEERWPNIRPVNGAPCFLQIHETAFLTRFYLDNMPSVRVVLSIISMQDFQTCSGDGAFFDTATARRYVFEHRPAPHLYFLNFRPKLFLVDVFRIRDMRTGADASRTLAMDRYGSGPLTLTPPEIRSDRTATPDCFKHLERFARELDGRRITWIVVLLPPMPAWGEAYDPSGARDQAWRETTKEHLRETKTIVLDGRNGPAFADRDFTDPDHLHWSSTAIFTQWIFRTLEQEAILAATFRGTANAL